MLMMRGWVPTQMMLMMLVMRSGSGCRSGTNAQWVSDKAWHPTEMMLVHGWVSAHDAWLDPYPNDADDAHDAWWVWVLTWHPCAVGL